MSRPAASHSGKTPPTRIFEIPRNRVRHELLPYLEREFSPGITGVLAREAAIARHDEARLQASNRSGSFDRLIYKRGGDAG